MTQTISDSDRNTYLRDHNQGVRLYLSVYRPDTVWEGTLDSVPSYPAVELDVSDTSGSIVDVKLGHTVNIYSSTGVYKGWLRIRQSALAGTLYISEIGEAYLNLEAGDVLKVVPWRRPVAKYHAYNAAGGNWLADYNIALSGKTEDVGPLARMGPPAVGFRDGSGDCEFKFVGEYSAAYSPSDSISTYAWDFPESETSASEGTAASPVTKTFSDPHPKGEEYSLTVTETTSGETHTRYSVLWTHDRSGANAPYKVAGSGLDSTLGVGGVLRVFLHGQHDADDLPRDAYICLWCETSYGGSTSDDLGGTYPFRSNVLFTGYIVSEVQNVTGVDGQFYTEVQAASVDEVLRRMAAYPLQMESVTGTPATWEEFKNLTIQRAMVVWAKWRAHTSMFDVWLGDYGDDVGIQYLDAPEGTLWEQLEYFYVNTLMGMTGASMAGDLYCNANIQFTPTADRWLSTPALNIVAPTDTRGQVVIDYRSYDDSAQETVSGVGWDTPFYSRAPDDPKGYMGVMTDQPPGLAVVNQSDLNEITGKLRAWKNRQIQRVVIPLPYFVYIDANPQTLVNLTIPAADHPRGFADFASGKDLVVTNVNYEFRDDLSAYTTLTCEPLVSGTGVADGVAFTPPTYPEAQWDQYIPPAWDYDLAFNDFPVFAEPSASDKAGDLLCSTDVGVFIANNLQDAFSGNALVYYGRNKGLPTGDASFYTRNLRISGFSEDSDKWTAIVNVWTSDKDTAGVYRNPDVWNADSSWELVYSETDFETDYGGSPGYLSFWDSYFSVIRTVGNNIYIVTMFAESSLEKRYIIRSSDGGDNWTVGTNPIVSAPYPAYSPWASALAVSANTGNLYGASYNSGNVWLSKSTDGGDTWSNVYNFGALSGSSQTVYAVHVPFEGNGTDQTIWVCNGAGTISRTQNGGTSFSSISMPGGWSGRVNHENMHSYTSDSDIMAFGSTGDNFATSTNANAATPTFTLQTNLSDIPSQVGGWPTDSNWFACAVDDAIELSDDGGTTWYDATGNLVSTHGMSNVYYVIPRFYG